MSPDPASQLKQFQGFLTLPRETVPSYTARETRRVLGETASRVGAELFENKANVPTFLMLPKDGKPPGVILFGTWHDDPSPPPGAALPGAERLALVAMLTALESGAAMSSPSKTGGPALVVAPSSATGSLVLGALLRDHRSRLQARSAYWIRIGSRQRRKRIYLGARGRVVLALWRGEANPYRLRDQIVSELTHEAFGPRPLDFELIRKLSASEDAQALLSQVIGASPGPGQVQDVELRFREALFGPRGTVAAPSTAHPDRPKAWITIDTAEGMEAATIATRIQASAGGGPVDIVEDFPWDRLNIHQREAQTLVALSKVRSEGPEVWPVSPWPTPSGVFNRTLGIGLSEWSLEIPQDAKIRFPTAPQLEDLVRELTEGLAEDARSDVREGTG